MHCDFCNNNEAHRLSYSNQGMSCDKCGDGGSMKFADVYFKEPYFDPMLADPKKSPNGTQITSRSHKAAVMRELGVTEAGDKRHGSRQRF